MGRRKKKQIDINDHSLWGHRFQFRERKRVQRQIYVPQIPQKRPRRQISQDQILSIQSQQQTPITLQSHLLQSPPHTSKAPKAPKAQALKKPKLKKKVKKQDIQTIIKKFLDQILQAVQKGNQTLKNIQTSLYFNCDLRYFNLEYIVQKFGYFDVICIDPPWRIRGGQKNSDTRQMFSNNKFQLNYDTLSNQQIMDIPIQKLSKKGFCFLWVLSGNMSAGYQCLAKWGYDVIDHLVWVKTTNGGRSAMISHGFYFLHSTETCLVGYKCPPGACVHYKEKVSNDIIIADVRKKSQKPDHLYTIIDMMMPGSKKVEVFARNNNLREGWLSLGNQLGEVFQNWRNRMVCDQCKQEISSGTPRFKSRKRHNFDVCGDCIEQVLFEKKQDLKEYFRMENQQQEEVLHHYHKCDRCGVEPIWGVRFQCLQCQNIDYCENCYDQISCSQIGCYQHIFKIYQSPEIGHGLPLHYDKRCNLCFQKPILGPCIVCADCQFLVLCQNCFFNCSFKEFENQKGHKPNHKLEIITLAQKKFQMSVCHYCGKSPLVSPKYKCDLCQNFQLCEQCYYKRESPASQTQVHPVEHTFTIY